MTRALKAEKPDGIEGALKGQIAQPPSEMLSILSNEGVYGSVTPGMFTSPSHKSSYTPAVLSRLLAFIGISIYNCG
jgi:hypothetical protein